MSEKQNEKRKDNGMLLKYAGMGFQFLAGIGLFLFFGMKADEWLHFRTPVFIWVLPLLFIISTIIKIIIETSKKK